MGTDMIDIIVPVHNEGGSIERTLRDFYRTVAVTNRVPIQFIICEDGSTDNTVVVLKTLAGELPIKLISAPVRKGYSRAVVDGIMASKSEWAAFVDSDGQYDPQDFIRLLSIRDNVDLVIGWRNPRVDPWVRKVMSFAFAVVYRTLFDVQVRDPSCPFLIVHRDALQKILSPHIGILKQGFWWEFMARASAANLKIVETPVQHKDRSSGKTQVYKPTKVPRIAIEHLLGLWKLRRELRASLQPQP
jgi:dolichol-phosphate mannosyltransferase